jgi:DNA-directed RNA polymerase I, II, and III subunit RPABC1
MANECIRLTCKSMIKQRGYDISSETQNYIIGSNVHNSIICFVTDIAKFSIDYVEPYVNFMKDRNFNRCIIVYKTDLTACARKTCEANSINIEFFSHKELMVDITQHILVPKHSLITGEDADYIRKRYVMDIPLLLKTDPISKFYGFEKGDIIKVERKGGSIAYRVVD